MNAASTPKRISVRKVGAVRLTALCQCPYSILT